MLVAPPAERDALLLHADPVKVYLYSYPCLVWHECSPTDFELQDIKVFVKLAAGHICEASELLLNKRFLSARSSHTVRSTCGPPACAGGLRCDD